MNIETGCIRSRCLPQNGFNFAYVVIGPAFHHRCRKTGLFKGPTISVYSRAPLGSTIIEGGPENEHLYTDKEKRQGIMERAVCISDLNAFFPTCTLYRIKGKVLCYLRQDCLYRESERLGKRKDKSTKRK